MIRVLIVDDEVFFSTSLQTYIDWGALGCVVVGTASDGEKALDAADRLRPDLILLDIQMPVMDGLEVLRRLRQRRCPAKVLMLTGFNQFDFVVQAMRLGAVDYIYKADMGEDTLAEAVRAQKENVERAAIPPGTRPAPDRPADEALRQAINSFGDMDSGLFAGLKIKPVNYYLLAFTFADPGSVMQRYGEKRRILYEGVRSLMAEALRNEAETEAFFYDKHTFCIAKSFSGEASQSAMLYELDYLANKVADQLYRFFNLQLFVGISGCHSGAEQMPKAYDEAYTAGLMEFSLERGRGHLFTQVEKCAVAEYLPTEECLQKLREGLEKQSPEVCRQAVGECFLVNKPDGVVFPAAAKSAAKNLLYSLVTQEDYRRLYLRQIERAANRSALVHLLSEIASNRIVAGRDAQAYNEIVRKAILCIQRKFAHADLSLDQIAGEVGVNASYLSRTFKREVGIGVADYINRIRVQSALPLLKHSEEKIYRIAEKVGYRSIEHFSRIFKKQTGCSPGDYRRARREE